MAIMCEAGATGLIWLLAMCCLIFLLYIDNSQLLPSDSEFSQGIYIFINI